MRWEKEKLREIKELEASLDFPLGKWGPLGWKISLYKWATALSPLKLAHTYYSPTPPDKAF
jgi:hypothetical protein